MSNKMTDEEKAAKKKRSAFNNFIKNVLRRSSYRWPPRGEAEKASRVARGLYKCAMCEGIFKRGQVELDHWEPVVPVKEDWMLPDGTPNWNIFIPRLFCESSNYKMLCITCHETKTASEDAMRAFYNAKRKEESGK